MVLVVACAVTVFGWTYPERNLDRARSEAVETLGPLELTRFLTDPACSDPAELAELALRTRVSDQEREDMRSTVNTLAGGSTPSLDSAAGERNRRLVAEWREWVVLSTCLDSAPESPGLPLPEGMVSLSRLHLLEFSLGLAALGSRDGDRALESICSLGAAARLLQTDADFWYQQFGLQAEHYQLVLVAEALRRGTVSSATMLECLVDNDLSQRSRDMIALESLYARYWLPSQVFGEQVQSESGLWAIERRTGWFRDLVRGKALERNLLVWHSIGLDLTLQRERVDYDEDWPRWKLLGMLAGIKSWTVGARYRVMGRSRQATRFALTRASSSSPCQPVTDEERGVGIRVVELDQGCEMSLELAGFEAFVEQAPHWVVPQRWLLADQER